MIGELFTIKFDESTKGEIGDSGKFKTKRVEK